MLLRSTLHALVQPQGRFISSPGTPERDFALNPLAYGDKVPVRVFAWNTLPMQPGQLQSCDLSPFYVELTVGSRNEFPSLGFFTIAFDGGQASSPINVNWMAAQVQNLLGTASVTVTGVPGNLIFTSVNTGARTTPVVAFSGNVDATPLVTEISGGSATTLAQWRVEIPEVAPASIPVDGWTVGSTTPESTAEAIPGTSDQVWRVTIDPNASTGFFRLNVNGVLTPFVPLGSSPSDVQNIVRTVPGGNGAFVSTGSYSACTYVISFATTVTLEVSSAGLVVPTSLLGTLDLSTDGIRDLLGESVAADAYLTLSVYDVATESLLTYAQSPVVVVMPVSRPTDHSGTPDLARMAFIYLPDMATGLWHRVTLAGTNAAPTFAIDTDGEEYDEQQGPIYIADTEDRSCYALVISGGNALMAFAVKAQGAALNASFQPRPFALASPENAALFCPVEVVPPALPAFAEPASLQLGTPV